MQFHKAYILLGSNMGRRKEFLQKAAALIAKHCGNILQLSSIYETAAWGNTHQKSFLNQVLVVQTKLHHDELMHTLLHIEQELGRTRKEKFDPRTIDLDILFFDRIILHSSLLTVPHPAIPNRRFVLVPMEEIAPGFVHPVYHKTIRSLLKVCTDPLAVKKL
jgi:2-amino-4-hydroxy-6-hydroxymethyldihydropteridine diphosphokinase